MKFGPRRYIDAFGYGNESRFINHSCVPNCRVDPWEVNGMTRLAIIADQDIAEDEEVTFDYQMCAKDTSWKCKCMAPNCRSGPPVPALKIEVKIAGTKNNIRRRNSTKKLRLPRYSCELVEEDWTHWVSVDDLLEWLSYTTDFALCADVKRYYPKVFEKHQFRRPSIVSDSNGTSVRQVGVIFNNALVESSVAKLKSDKDRLERLQQRSVPIVDDRDEPQTRSFAVTFGSHMYHE